MRRDLLGSLPLLGVKLRFLGATPPDSGGTGEGSGSIERMGKALSTYNTRVLRDGEANIHCNNFRGVAADGNFRLVQV